MNERGKLKHRFHILVFRRGAVPAQDELVAHVVTARHRFRATVRRLNRYFTGAHEAWVADEAYWREHGVPARPTTQAEGRA